jgi:PAS domain S-box-containing protein
MDPDPTARITGILRANPKGIGITRIAQKAGIHRSTAIKYLELLRASGNAEMQMMGMTKLYTLSQRVPLSAMFDLQDEIFVVLDSKCRIVQVNERYEAICGLSHERVIGTILGKSELPILTDPEILATIKSLESPEILVCLYLVPGEDFARHYRIRIIPTVFEGGKIGVTIIGVDITREQEISHQLSATETRYQAILDQLPDLVCSFLPDFTIIQANRAFRDRFGGRKSKNTGENFPDMVYGKDNGEIQSLFASLSENTPSFIHEQHVVSPGDGKGKVGQNRWLRWTYHAEYDPPGTLMKIQATGTDITTEKELGEKVGQQDRDIGFLSQKAFEFAHHSPETDIYEAIGNGALQLVPDAIISLSSFDPSTCSLTVRTIVGDRGNVFKKFCDKSIGLEMPIDPEPILILKTGNLFQVPGGVHVVTFGQIPPMVCSRIEKKIHLVSTYAIGLSAHEQLLGAMGILKCGEGPIERPDTLTAYTRISALALRNWLAEKSSGSKK